MFPGYRFGWTRPVLWITLPQKPALQISSEKNEQKFAIQFLNLDFNGIREFQIHVNGLRKYLYQCAIF